MHAITAADRALLHASLRRVAPFSDEDLAQLDRAQRGWRIRRLARGARFLEPGDTAVDCGSITSGLVREYFPLADGREVTRGFAGPGDYVGSLSDLLTGEPAKSAVVAETDARIVVIAWAQIRAAAAQRPAWASFLARVTERLYLAKAAREYELLALDAEARYLRFLAQYAALEPEIALRHVASYIGVTPEHLSRLRRRLAGAPPESPAQSRSESRSSARSSRSAAARAAPRRARSPG